MDSNASSYLFNHAALSSYLGKEDSSIIDLGLSLRIVQPNTCYSHDSHSHDNYDMLVDWQQLHPQMQKSDDLQSNEGKGNGEDESESKQQWSYVKVNMDGVVVGRKVCLFEQMDYFTLALHLEEMFGKVSMCGLRLLEADSAFTLFYKDRYEQWRKVGDVPWKEFVEGVKRLRIACKDVIETNLLVSSSPFAPHSLT